MMLPSLAATVLIAAAVSTAVTVAAEEPDPLRGIRNRQEIEALVDGLRSGRLKGPQALFDREGGPHLVYTSYIENRKGAADIHVADDEIFVVISGTAACTLGGDIADKTLVRPNEYRGTRIAGGVTKQVGPGDFISAPRGTPHQMDPGTGHILYIVIKVIGR
jgi:mannose-6-phosphate isomerase-like protein (cupin superfamily)